MEFKEDRCQSCMLHYRHVSILVASVEEWLQVNENGVTEEEQKYKQGSNDKIYMELGHGKQIGIER
jgi:hypothetical protein